MLVLCWVPVMISHSSQSPFCLSCLLMCYYTVVITVVITGHSSAERWKTGSALCRTGQRAGQSRQNDSPLLQRRADSQGWPPPSGRTDVPQVSPHSS